MLELWVQLDGNRIELPNDFIQRLLLSIPTEPDTSKVARVRLPIRGFLHEVGVRQLAYTPLFIDSQTTVFVAQDLAGVKRSIWILRRINVIHEAVEMREILPVKIKGTLNPANALTKYVTHSEWQRYARYVLNADVPEEVYTLDVPPW